MALLRYNDIIERLNFVWSCVILLSFSLFIGFLRYFFLSALITCWTPAQFSDNHNHYATQKCWELNMTYVPKDDTHPRLQILDSEKYQVIHTWVPVLAVCMIVGFKIPEGLKIVVDLFLGSKQNIAAMSMDSWEGRAEYLAMAGKDILNRGGIVRTLFYFLIIILINANLVAQFVFTRTYFQDSIIEKTGIDGQKFNITRLMFPKAIMCDFDIRRISNVELYTVQCDMPVNHLYEVFFTSFSYWILLVGLLTSGVFVIQFLTLLVPPFVRIRFRGIIPEKELNLRGCSVDDVLLFLEDIKDEFGVGMARHVASKIWGPRVELSVPVQYHMADRGRYGNQPSAPHEASAVYPLIEQKM